MWQFADIEPFLPLSLDCVRHRLIIVIAAKADDCEVRSLQLREFSLREARIRRGYSLISLLFLPIMDSSSSPPPLCFLVSRCFLLLVQLSRIIYVYRSARRSDDVTDLLLHAGARQHRQKQHVRRLYPANPREPARTEATFSYIV